MNNNRIWTKEYVLLMASNFFVAINFYALLATGAIFAIDELGTSETQGGIAAGIFVVGSLSARIVISRYANRIGFKRTIIIGLSALVISSALLFIVNSFVLLCIVRFLCGASFGVNNNTMFAEVTLIIPNDRKGEGLGWFSLSQILGIALGPFFAVSLLNLYSFREVFMMTFFSGAAAFAFYLVLSSYKDRKAKPTNLKEFQNSETIPAPQKQERGIWQFFEPSAVKISILCFLIYIGYSNYMAFAAVYLTVSGAVNISSVVFLASAGAMLVLRPFVGKSFDLRGPNLMLTCGFIFLSGGLLIFSLGNTTAVFLSAAILIGLGLTSLQGTTVSIVVTNAPRHRLTVANATYFLAFDLGSAVGPTLGGRIAEFTSFSALYTVCAIVVIACLPLYFGVLAKRN